MSTSCFGRPSDGAFDRLPGDGGAVASNRIPSQLELDLPHQKKLGLQPVSIVQCLKATLSGLACSVGGFVTVPTLAGSKDSNVYAASLTRTLGLIPGDRSSEELSN